MAGRIGVILVAAGVSRRMEGIDKIFAPLRGRPLFDCTFGVLASVPEIAEGVIVLSEQGFGQGQEVLTARGWSVGWNLCIGCLLYTSPRPRDATLSRMPSSA